MHQLSSLSPVRNSAAIDGDRGIHPSERAKKKHPLARLATMAPSLSTTRPQPQNEETFGPFPHSQHKDCFPLMLQVTQAGPDDFPYIPAILAASVPVGAKRRRDFPRVRGCFRPIASLPFADPNPN